MPVMHLEARTPRSDSLGVLEFILQCAHMENWCPHLGLDWVHHTDRLRRLLYQLQMYPYSLDVVNWILMQIPLWQDEIVYRCILRSESVM